MNKSIKRCLGLILFLGSWCAQLSASIPIIEREALIALYNSTGGESWGNKANWLGEPGTEANWYGVTVDNDHVSTISLEGNNLSGKIPTELGNLINLQTLNLENNRIQGSIPSQLGNLTNLNSLFINSNQLTGAIPGELGNLTVLEHLRLNNNQLTEAIPIQLSKLVNLEVLDLSWNLLTGGIPEQWGNLAKLQNLNLSVNRITGVIPVSLGNLASLQDLHLNDNQLTGTIPFQFENLQNLQHLWLNNNLLVGKIPAQLGKMAALQSIAFWSNQLTGSIPTEFGNLVNLQKLDLGANELTGAVPASFGNLVNLQILILSINKLSGAIPAQLGNAINLQYLDISGNQLSGSIPPQLGNLALLRWLSLAVNQLSGSIPAELGNLTKLQDLLLEINHLTGTIPPQLGNLTDLDWMDLSKNQLTGTIPPELGNLSNLRGLYMSNNQLTGVIPSELGNLANLREMNLSNNQLTGEVPAALINLTKLSDVYGLKLENNHLQASDPTLKAFLDRKHEGEPGDWLRTETPFLLNISKTGTGIGHVVSDPPGIDCGTTCSAYYAIGTVVILTAAPANGSMFAGWEEVAGAGSYVVTMNSSQLVTASFVPAPPIATLEAENAALSGAMVAKNHTGYTGTGFSDYLNASNDFIEWTYNAPVAGSYLLDFRYALASGNRPLKISVNGKVATANLSFPSTGDWTRWLYTGTTKVSLNIGVNKIRATCIGSSGANIDHLRVKIADPVLRIESGSPAPYTDTLGNLWFADQWVSGGKLFDHGNVSIPNTTDPRIYQTERYGMTGYSIPVDNGVRTVTLHFAENYFNATYQRQFDVKLEGNTVLSDFDIFAQADGKNKAVIKTFTANVTDGILDIGFVSHINNPCINGIEVR